MENNCGGWQKNSFPGEEKPLHNSWPDQEHSPGNRCMCQQSREDFTSVNTEGSPQDVNHWWASKNRKNRLVCQTTSKKPLQFWNKILWTDETKINLGREEYGEGKELLMIQNIPPHQWSMVVVVSWCRHVWLPIELVPLYLLMMWLLTKAAGWILKCFRQYYLLIFSQMLQNSLDGAQCRCNQRVF